jgi:nucleotide-binding universal stress UspA family protein
MKTEQLIWFIDSRYFYLNISLDKIIHLANIHHKKITIVIDAKGKNSEPWYAHLLNEKSLPFNDDNILLAEKQVKLLNFFKMNAIKAEILICPSINYAKILNDEIAKNTNSLVIIEDTHLAKRHPIFQMLTQIKAPILLLSNKIWKHPIKILGAIDPLHENARPETIDNTIVELMLDWGKTLKAKHIIAHCCYISPVLSQYKKKIITEHDQALKEYSKNFRVTKEQQILLEGKPEEVLPTYIRDNQIDVLFIGLVARNKLSQFWIGSTTSALLAALPCDMLLVQH